NKDEPERLKNVEELLNAIRDFVDSEAEPDLETGEININPKSLSDFLNQVSLMSDSDEKDDENVDKSAMMTIHSAKGLEFPLVFIVGMEENLFPSFMSLNSRSELEEERRLFYVALTRAELKTYITFAETRYKWGQITFAEPSRFIEDIDPQFLEYINPKATQKKAQATFASAKPEQGKYNLKTKPTTPQASLPNLPQQNIPSNYKKINAVQTIIEPKETAAINDLQENQRIYHNKFGAGEILELSGSDDNKRAVIQFDTGETKTLLLKYAKLSIQ
ncbi:MAG: ATP-dependent DNA helicase, partial [Sphingobacteriia bacterium]|nr:ATP-dependent DNA helicase [Sphingobacteriia bacterium]